MCNANAHTIKFIMQPIVFIAKKRAIFEANRAL